MYGFYPNSTSTGTKPASDKERADRYEKALREMLDLPLPKRAAVTYIGIARDALGVKPK